MRYLITICLLLAGTAFGAEYGDTTGEAWDAGAPDPDAGYGADASQNDDDKGAGASQADWFSDMGLVSPGLDGSSEGVNQNPYDRYGGAIYVLYDTGLGERKAPTAWLNSAAHNYNYTRNNDSLAQGGEGDSLYQATEYVTTRTSEVVVLAFDEYGNAVTDPNSGRDLINQIENTVNKAARKIGKWF